MTLAAALVVVLLYFLVFFRQQKTETPSTRVLLKLIEGHEN